MRGFLGLVAGLVAGLAALFVVGTIAGYIFPTPARVDSAMNAEQLVAATAAMSMGARLALLGCWFVGALVGAAVAKRVSGAAWAAWTVTLLVTLMVLVSVLVLPLPGWLQALAVVAPLIGGFIGNHLVDGLTAVDEEDVRAV